MPLFKQGVDRRTGMSGLRHYKMLKHLEIQEGFNDFELNGYMMSSLGFPIECTREALSNVDGLLYIMTEVPGNIDLKLPFKDYQAITRVIGVSEVRILRKDLITYGAYQYNKKWELEQANIACTSKEEVEAIVVDFYPIKVDKPPAIPDI